MLPFPLLHHLIPFPCRLGLFYRVAPHLASTYLSFPLNDRIYSDLANSPCYTLASRAAQHFLFLLWDSSVPSCPIDHQTIVTYPIPLSLALFLIHRIIRSPKSPSPSILQSRATPRRSFLRSPPQTRRMEPQRCIRGI